MSSLPEELPIASANSVTIKFADRFFQKVFERKEAIQDLLQFVVEEMETETTSPIEIIYQKPVLIGNRENDLSFLFHQTYYYFLNINPQKIIICPFEFYFILFMHLRII